MKHSPSAPQSDVAPPASSLQTPQKESSSSSSSFRLDLPIIAWFMLFILIGTGILYFITTMVALLLQYISGMGATKANSIVLSIIDLIIPVPPLYSFYHSRNSKEEQEAQGDDSRSTNDYFAQDTIGCCATLILSACASMLAFDEDRFINRTFCGVVILSSLVALGAAMSRYRLMKKKNCNPYLNRFSIFMSAPFIMVDYYFIMMLIGSMARYLTAANDPSTL